VSTNDRRRHSICSLASPIDARRQRRRRHSQNDRPRKTQSNERRRQKKKPATKLSDSVEKKKPLRQPQVFKKHRLHLKIEKNRHSYETMNKVN